MILLAGNDPVAKEGVMRHQRGNEDRLKQIALNFRIDIVTRKRQRAFRNLFFQRIPRDVEADKARGQEADGEQKTQNDREV